LFTRSQIFFTKKKIKKQIFIGILYFGYGSEVSGSDDRVFTFVWNSRSALSSFCLSFLFLFEKKGVGESVTVKMYKILIVITFVGHPVHELRCLDARTPRMGALRWITYGHRDIALANNPKPKDNVQLKIINIYINDHSLEVCFHFEIYIYISFCIPFSE
jgi:hypothetical protein